MFNPKKERRNKKNDKIPPQTLCFLFLFVVVLGNIMQQQILG
jgi:hypothetical protein